MITNTYDRAGLQVWLHKQRTDCFYARISLQDHGLEVERAWGVSGTSDAQLLELLGRNDAPILKGWQVLAGGEGYEYKTFHQGIGWQSLYSYCLDR
ncbi:MAG: hypothetical protein AAGF24_07965 [Cyanobacteria bacterium P01_H01_bin.121]